MKELLPRFLQAAGILSLTGVILIAVVAPAGGVLGFVTTWYIVSTALLFAYTVLSGSRGGVSLLVAFFFLFFIAIPAGVQVSTGVFPFNSTYSPQQLLSGYVILGLGQLGYVAGEAIADSRRSRRPPRAPKAEVPRERLPMDTQFFRRATLALTVLSVALIPLIGFNRLFYTRADRSDDFATSEGVWQQALFVGRSTTLLALLFAIFLILRDRESRRIEWFRWTFALTIVVFLLFNYPPGLSRFSLLGAVIAIAAMIVNFFKPSVKLIFAACAPVFLFFLLPAIKVLGEGRNVDIVAAFGRDVETYLVRVDFDGFKQTVDTWIYTLSEGYRFGENFLGAALFFVPRGLWPGKPIDSGYLVSTSLGYSYNNVANTLPSEGFISFGYLGALGVMALFGWFVSRTEYRSRLVQESRTLFPDPVLNSLLMGFVTIVLRGSLNGVVPMFASGFLAYFLIIYVHWRRQNRKDGRGPRLHHPRRTEGGDHVAPSIPSSA